MSSEGKKFWNDSYDRNEFVYGQTPNAYLKEKLLDLNPGKILLPAEGEGRNAVYAAQLGWEVCAFDQSKTGKDKAENLAEKNKVQFDYRVAAMESIEYPEKSFDALAFIFAHMPSSIRRKSHQKLTGYLKGGGTLVLEAFDKKHAQNQKENPSAGGPKNLDMLYSIDDLKEDFDDFDFRELESVSVELNEGVRHVGKGQVIRLLATKR